MGPSYVVYVEKRRGPRTDPWGTPVTNWCALDTSPPQATLKDWPVRQDSNQRSGIPVMPSDERVDRRIGWLTVSKAADRSSRMRTDDLESAFAIRRTSVTESSAVSVEWATPETWLFSVQFVFLWKKQWDLVEDNSFECFGYEWKERDSSVVFYKISV